MLGYYFTKSGSEPLRQERKDQPTPANARQRQSKMVKFSHQVLQQDTTLNYKIVSKISHWYSLPTLLFLTQKLLGPPSCLLPFLLPLHVQSRSYQERAPGIGRGGRGEKRFPPPLPQICFRNRIKISSFKKPWIRDHNSITL